MTPIATLPIEPAIAELANQIEEVMREAEDRSWTFTGIVTWLGTEPSTRDFYLAISLLESTGALRYTQVKDPLPRALDQFRLMGGSNVS